MLKGTLHLIPNILADDAQHYFDPNLVKLCSELKVFFVEEIRSARRLLKRMNKSIDIESLDFYMLNEHENKSLSIAKQLLNNGTSIAYISEAGCPSVADPGQELAALAHSLEANVVPHVGASSILLALMASGFNSQQFYFHGYLPNKQPALADKIKELEQQSQKKQLIQIFIETPYRNHQLVAELCKICMPLTRLCIASDLTSPQQYIRTYNIAKWRKQSLSIHKKPTVYLLYAGAD